METSRGARTVALLGKIALSPKHILIARQLTETNRSQCGGQGWSGATCCTSGYTCVKSNDYYFQCILGQATTTAAPAPPTTTTKASSTTKVTTTTTKAPPPTTTGGSGTTTAPPAPGGTGTASYSGNPYSGVAMWANPYYASEVSAYAAPTLGAVANQVGKVPSYMWLDTRSKVPLMADYLAQIRKENQAGASPPKAGLFVVYDLPDRDCAAAASNGEFSIADGGVAKYKEYIDAIAELVEAYPDVRMPLIIGKSMSFSLSKLLLLGQALPRPHC